MQYWVKFHQNTLELSSNFTVIIIVVSVALVVVLIVLFALYLYREKKREGITYEKAIAIINEHIEEHHGGERGPKRAFCEKHGINYKSLTRAINLENPKKMPELVEDTLKKIDFDVVLENKSTYFRND